MAQIVTYSKNLLPLCFPWESVLSFELLGGCMILYEYHVSILMCQTPIF